MISGTKQQIPINTQPQGADLTITRQACQVYGIKADTVVVAKTPYIFNANRINNYKITITKDGYQEYSIFTSKKLNSAIAGNIFFGGLIGAAIDTSTGASNIILPERIDVGLIPKKNDIEIKDKE